MVSGVDNECTMIDQAKTSLKHEIVKGMVELHESDALDYLISIREASVDVIASSYTIHNCFRDYRALLENEIFRVLKPGGMFINNDKYTADDRQEYVRELTDQIIRYDVLREIGRDDLRRIWIEHEMEYQVPERIMWTAESLNQLKSVGFMNILLVERIGQYAIMTAYKAL
jgi:ubiquinone/menaquinone biosynthesis C-methylase UbiE